MEAHFISWAIQGRVKDTWKDRPILEPSLQFIYTAWCELRQTCSISQTEITAISGTQITTWLDLHGITDSEERLEIYEMISRLDSRWRSSMARKLKDSSNSSSEDGDGREDPSGEGSISRRKPMGEK